MGEGEVWGRKYGTRPKWLQKGQQMRTGRAPGATAALAWQVLLGVGHRDLFLGSELCACSTSMK